MRIAGVALALALTRAGHSAEEGMSVNLGAQQVSQAWNFGDLHPRLDVSLARTARVWLAGNRVWVSVKAANPELTNKLQASFRSPAKSGYTSIARTGSTEVSLGSVRGISLSTDDRKAVWVRATVRLQQRAAGVTTTGEKQLTARLEPSVVGHALIFTVKALELEGVSQAVNRSIAQRIQPIRLDLPECAEGLRFESLQFAEKENAVNLTASVSGTDLLSLLPCLTGLE